MSGNREFASPALLAQAFKEVCAENRTGILQIITSGNEVLTLCIKGGSVVSVKCKTKRNREALQELGAIGSGKHKFFERGEVDEISTDLPTNDEVIEYLLSGSVTSTSTSAPAEVNSNKQLPDSVKKSLEAALTEQIGPIASMLCQNIFSEETDPDTIISMLAESIPDNNQAQSFKAEAKHLLKQK